MKNIFTSLLLITTSTLLSQWNILEIGTSTTDLLDDIIMVDGRNDGKQRIYVGSEGGTVEEWSWNGTSWSNTDIITGIYEGLIQIGGGDGRNDGVNRIYVGEHTDGGNLYELTWDGSTWVSDLVLDFGAVTSIMIGEARNDGISRLYIGGHDISELEWNGSAWDITEVSTEYSESHGIIGDANNDGVDELYINGDCEKGFLWTGSSWFESYLIGSCSSGEWTDANHIAIGRNDGLNRLYINGEALGKKEYSWNGTSWSETTINIDSPGRGDIHVAALHNDTLQRVYGSNSAHWTGTPAAGPLEEFEWNGTTWVNNGTILDGTSGASGWMVAGTGRNDDTMRLYIPNVNTHGIYEITSVNPNYVGEPEIIDDSGLEDNSNLVHFEIYPNPASDILIISLQSAPTEKVNLIITNTIGEVVEHFNQVDLTNKTTINLKNYSNGVYIVRIESDGESNIQRLVIQK